MSLACENLSASGVEASDYSGDSVSNGSAKIAAACRIEDFLIQTLGCWKVQHICIILKCLVNS